MLLRQQKRLAGQVSAATICWASARQPLRPEHLYLNLTRYPAQLPFQLAPNGKKLEPKVTPEYAKG